MRVCGIFLLCGCLSLAGCASWPGVATPKAAEVPSRDQRRAEVIQSFEEQRDRAQLAAAMDRWQQGDIAGCETRVRGILARRPTDVDAHVLLAELAFSCHNPAEAEAEYRTALGLAPQRADIHHALALVLEATGRHPEAGVHFVRAAEIEPSSDLYRLR
jgi:Tfp pilus assembly protein PilF